MVMVSRLVMAMSRTTASAIVLGMLRMRGRFTVNPVGIMKVARYSCRAI
jgi:hypothetical protein